MQDVFNCVEYSLMIDFLRASRTFPVGQISITIFELFESTLSNGFFSTALSFIDLSARLSSTHFWVQLVLNLQQQSNISSGKLHRVEIL